MIGLRLRFGTAQRSPPSASPESAGGAAAASDAIWFHNFYCSNTAWVKQVVRFVEENKTTRAIEPLDFAEQDFTNGTIPRCLPSMHAVLFSTGVIPSTAPNTT